jgi:dTDP-4-amino-4,6-dideoxygalactose transaminase
MKYKVPFVDLPLQYHRHGDENIAAIRDAMSRGDYILRSDLEQFEENMASCLGMKYVVGVGSGTDALYLALKAAGVGSYHSRLYLCSNIIRHC